MSEPGSFGLVEEEDDPLSSGPGDEGVMTEGDRHHTEARRPQGARRYHRLRGLLHTRPQLHHGGHGGIRGDFLRVGDRAADRHQRIQLHCDVHGVCRCRVPHVDGDSSVLAERGQVAARERVVVPGVLHAGRGVHTGVGVAFSQAQQGVRFPPRQEPLARAADRRLPCRISGSTSGSSSAPSSSSRWGLPSSTRRRPRRRSSCSGKG